jgi:hypothetical protein
MTALGGLSPGDSAGQIGKATSFNGSQSAYSAAPLTARPFSILAWFNQTDGAALEAIFSLGWLTNAVSYFLALTRGDASDTIQSFSRLSASTVATTGNSWAAGSWSMMAQLHDDDGSLTDTIQLDDGAEALATIGKVPIGVDNLEIGALANGAHTNSFPFGGLIQGVQAHSVVRSADWRSEEYAQTSDQATFWGTWAWEEEVLQGEVLQFAAVSTPVLSWEAESTASLEFKAISTGVLEFDAE